MIFNYYRWLTTAFSLALLLKAAAQSSLSCASLDDLIARTNRDELNCIAQESCIGVQCTSINSQFRLYVEATRLTLLPCASTPAVLLELLGAVDPLTEQRRVVFTGELSGDIVIPLVFNTIPFGNVNVTFELLEQSVIQFALQRYDEGAMETVQLINPTRIRLDLNTCPRQTESTTISTDSSSTGTGTVGITTTSGTAQTALPLSSLLVAATLLSLFASTAHVLLLL